MHIQAQFCSVILKGADCVPGTPGSCRLRALLRARVSGTSVWWVCPGLAGLHFSRLCSAPVLGSPQVHLASLLLVEVQVACYFK